MGLLMMQHLKEKKNYKLSKKQQQQFIHLLADLLKNGFTIQESLLFMKKSHSIPTATADYLSHFMENGRPFYRSLAAMNFPSSTITQIEFAQTHGNLPMTLEKINKHMHITNQQKQNMYKVLSYPALLCTFLVIVLLSIRQFLLPQLMANSTIQKENIGLLIIQQSPYYLLLLFAGAALAVFGGMLYLKNRTAFQKAILFSKIPVFGFYYKEYCSAYFALEWGKLFAQGLESKMVIQLMKVSHQQTLMKELAEKIEAKSMLGETFYQQLPTFPFFLPELALIVQQGEIKGNLGKELIIYSDICWQQLFKRVDKSIQWIQPAIFLVIALLVVGVYAAMLLPIYGGMENYL